MEEYVFICASVLSGILGVCVGSFLNVVIYRLPREMSLSHPGSHCTSCDYSLKWYDNIPVLSWIILGGRCRKCRQPISPRYTIVELANMAFWLLSVILFWNSSPIYAVTCAIVCSVLICIFFIDLEHMLIFNRFTIIVAACGIISMFFDSFTKPIDHIIGAAAGGGVLVLLYFGAILILKREAMGFADVKLVAAAGLLLGWQKLIFAILVGSVVGSVVMITLNRVKNQEKDTEYPFGPFICGGVLLALLAGGPIVDWYINLILG